MTTRSNGAPLALAAAGLLAASGLLRRRGGRNLFRRARVEVLLQPDLGGVGLDDDLVRIEWEKPALQIDSITITGRDLEKTGALDVQVNKNKKHLVGLLHLFASWVHNLPFPLQLYRGLHLNRDQDYRQDHQEAQYWSADERVALRFARFARADQKMQLLQSEPVPAHRVHWLSTLGQFLLYSVHEAPEYEIVVEGEPKVVRVQEFIRRSDLLSGSKNNDQRIFYHGTRSVDAAASILRQGQVRTRPSRSMAYFAPLPGRAYMTASLPEALAYSFGGATGVVDGKIETAGSSPEGAVVVVEASLADCVPDEDWLGRVVLDQLERRPWTSWRGQPVKLRVLSAVNVALDMVPARTLAGWKGYRALRDDALEARTGKTMINLLMKTKKGRSMLTRLAELSPNIACLPQAVTVLGAYRVRKDDLGRLKPDGSNLSEALEPIVVPS
jgi:hypothetical protein